MKHFKTSSLIALSIVSLTFCEVKSQASESTKTKLSTEINKHESTKKTYKLKGFKQSCCSGIVEYSLKEVDGFIKSESKVKEQKLTVWFDKTKCTEEDIEKAINKTPYKILE